MSKIYLPSELINNNYIYTYNTTNRSFAIVNPSTCAYINQPTSSTTRYNECTVYVYQTELNRYFTTTQTITTSLSSLTFSSSDFSDSVWYRNDITDILIIFLILFIFIIMYPMRLLMRLFGRWLKL